jgi:hypothetical protein
VRALALIAATSHLGVVAVVAFLMWFWATFPYENQRPEDAAADDWLILAAALVLGLAIAFTIAIAFAVATFAPVGLGVGVGLIAAEFAADAALLRYGLEASQHSDGRLLVPALGATATGVAAVIAARQAQASHAMRP